MFGNMASFCSCSNCSPLLKLIRHSDSLLKLSLRRLLEHPYTNLQASLLSIPMPRRINLATVSTKSHPKAVLCLLLVKLIDAVQNAGLTPRQRRVKEELTELWEMFEKGKVGFEVIEGFLMREDVEGVMRELGISG